MQKIIIDFFLCDGPILSDLIRMFIYAYLLMDCLISPHMYPPVGNTPLQADVLLQRTRPMFWCLSNKFSALFLIIHRYEYLKWMIRFAKLSWFCCIIGFGGVVSRLITGILIFILSGTLSGINKIGVSHRWHVPMWTLLALIFTKFKSCSVDHLIHQYIDHHYNVEPTNILFDSGLTSKFVQCISLYTLFAGGISKLRNGGLTWVLPGNLMYHLSDPFMESITFCQTIRNRSRCWILKHRKIILFMSIFALLFELVSIVAVFFSSTRSTIFILANLFHLGIWFFLLPNYFPQCVCYLTLIDIPFFATYPCQDDKMILITYVDKFIICIVMMIIFGYTYSLIFQYEGWPFTSIPMYSFDRRHYRHEYILDEKQFIQLCQDEYPLMNGFCTGGEDQFSEGNRWIRITKNDDHLDLIPEISFAVCPMEHGFRHSLWSAILRSVLISKCEIAHYIEELHRILVADDIQLINRDDILKIKIHFKDEWKIFYQLDHSKRD